MLMCQAKDRNCLVRTVGPTIGFCRFEADRNGIRFKFQEDHLGSRKKNGWAMQNGKRLMVGEPRGRTGLCPGA